MLTANKPTIYKYLSFLITIIVATFAICGVAIWTGLDSFLFAWVLNFMLMMCLFAFTRTVKPKFASNYYGLKGWERGGKIYKFFGVNIFRKFLVWTGWEKFNKKGNPVKKSLKALKNLEYATRQSEFGHIAVFIIVMLFAFFMVFRFGITSATSLLLLNILLNLYPIMVQRYNRPKLKRLLRIKLAK